MDNGTTAGSHQFGVPLFFYVYTESESNARVCLKENNAERSPPIAEISLLHIMDDPNFLFLIPLACNC